MLILAPPLCIISAINLFKDLYIFNYNSYVMGYPNSGLIPSQLPIASYSDSFDSAYLNCLLRDDNMFCNLFRIISLLQSGSNILLISDNSNYEINLPESLLKIIQQRYGYNGAIANDPEDLYSLKESNFSIPGLYNYDADNIRYCTLSNIPIPMTEF